MGTDATRRHRGLRDPRADDARRPVAARLALALTAVGVLAAMVVAPGPGSAPARAAAAPYAMTVDPTTGLVDGQPVDVMVRPAAGSQVLSSVIYICRDDATYTTEQDLVPMVTGKCADRPVSSSASGPWPIRAYADGSAAVSRVRVGTGTVTWGPSADPKKFSLTCDPTHPCRMVMEVQTGGGSFIDSSTVLQFVDNTPLSSCGGTADGAPDTVGSDRLLGPVGRADPGLLRVDRPAPTDAIGVHR